MKLRVLVAVAVATGFTLGFAILSEGAHAPLHGVIAWLVGDSGGCDLPSMWRAPYRISKLSQDLDLSARQTRQVETAPDGFTRWETLASSYWVPPGNSPAFAVGEQLSEVYTLPPMNLGPTDVVLDCGANYGSFVRTCLRGGVRKVIAIEPDPANVEALRRNFMPEIATGQVVIVAKGVWHEESTPCHKRSAKSMRATGRSAAYVSRSGPFGTGPTSCTLRPARRGR